MNWTSHYIGVVATPFLHRQFDEKSHEKRYRRALVVTGRDRDLPRIKRDTVYKWINRKKMPAHKVGSLWKFKRGEIDAWLLSGEASETPEPNKPR